MLRRAITALVLLLIGLPAVLLGGPFFLVLLTVILAGAAREYVQMFRAAGFEAQPLLTVGGVVLILAARGFAPDLALPILAFLVLAAMAVHVLAFERGREGAAGDFAVTTGGLVYLGWIGAYLMDLRNLPEGGWWFMLVLPTIWLADTGAYSLGAAYGVHKMTPRLSPKKSWEGFWAGVFTSVIAAMFFAFAYGRWGNLTGDVTLAQAALLGLLLGVLTPLGDLGESMFKRQAHMKDSSEIIPGHGGLFDRIDSWLWAGVIGYYFILWFVR